MDEERKRQMLAYITDLKEERYIGTQQAWNYLKGVERAEDRLNIIESHINGYSPDRPPIERRHILGTYKFVKIVMDSTHKELSDLVYKDFGDVSQENQSRSDKLERNFDRRWNSVSRYLAFSNTFFSEDASLIREFAKDLDSAVEFASHEDCFDHVSFEDNLVIGTVEMALCSSQLQKKERNHVRDAIGKTYDIIRPSLLLSDESLPILTRSLKKEIFSHHCPLYERVHKVINDQVEHHLFRQREIAMDSVAGYGDDLDGALSALRGHYASSKERIEAINEIEGADLSGPALRFVAQEKKIAERLQVEIHSIVSNRAFLERYLKN